MALTNNQTDVAQFLLDSGANPTPRTRRGGRRSGRPSTSAISICDSGAHCENGVDRDPVLRLIAELIEKGADVNARVKEFPPERRHMMPLGSLEWVDFTGQTPFIRAALSADVPLMRLLISKGADPELTTFNGTTALMAAAGVNWVVGQTFSESPSPGCRRCSSASSWAATSTPSTPWDSPPSTAPRTAVRTTSSSCSHVEARSWISRTKKVARRSHGRKGLPRHQLTRGEAIDDGADPPAAG